MTLLPPRLQPDGGDGPLRVDPPRRLGRRSAALVALTLGLVVLVAVVHLVRTVRDDERAGHPGARTDVQRVLVGALAPPLNADVADFEVPAPDGDLGPIEDGRRWRLDAPSWSVAQGLAVGTPTGGEPAVATTPTGATSYLLQVDLLDPSPGSGLLFRYRSEADHWRLVLDTTEQSWVVERVSTGVVEELGRFDKRQGRFQTIGVWVDGGRITAASHQRPALELRAEVGEAEDRVGMISTAAESRFDNFAIDG